MNFRVDGLGVSSVWMNMGSALRYGRFYLHESLMITHMGAAYTGSRTRPRHCEERSDAAIQGR
jgi:hypothetical protein